MRFRLFKPFQSSQRAAILFSSVLIALMMGCVGISYVQFTHRIVPGWPAGYVPWLCALIALQVTYTRLLTRDKSLTDQISSYAAQWVVLFFLIKLLTILFGGEGSLVQQISLWEKDLIYFFSPLFFAVLLPSVLVWVISFIFANDLANIQMDESELLLENPAMLDKNRVDYRAHLGDWVMVVGIVTVMMAFFARLGLVRLFGELPSTRAPVYNVVAYFLFGFLLLSQAQLSSLQRSWLWDKIPTHPRLGRRWMWYGVLFFFLLALLALLLPTRYTMGLLDTLRAVIGIVMQLFAALIWLITYPFIALFNLLFTSSKEEQPQQPLQMPHLPQNPSAPGQPLPWLEILRSVLIWLSITAIVIYFFRYYLRQNKHLLAVLGQVKLFHWLGRFWGGLWSWLRGVNAQLGQALKTGRERIFPKRQVGLVNSLRRMVNFQSLSPRQRVIFFYLRMVERGGEEGIPRAPAQTPSQYSRQLRETLPDVEPELDSMTAAFLEARYSPHDVGPDDAETVQSWWKRILQALRSARKQKPD